MPQRQRWRIYAVRFPFTNKTAIYLLRRFRGIMYIRSWFVQHLTRGSITSQNYALRGTIYLRGLSIRLSNLEKQLFVQPSSLLEMLYVQFADIYYIYDNAGIRSRIPSRGIECMRLYIVTDGKIRRILAFSHSATFCNIICALKTIFTKCIS